MPIQPHFVTQPQPRAGDIDRFLAGLVETDLVTDLAEGHHTLLAPVNAAFDPTPWPFERLLRDDELLEERFDLFEYLVVRGVHGASGPGVRLATISGPLVTLGDHQVVGERGVAHVLDSLIWRNALVHVIDACVYQTVDPRG